MSVNEDCDLSARGVGTGVDDDNVPLLTRLDARKTKVSSREVLATTTELLDLPYERRLVWGILHTPCGRLTNVKGRNVNCDFIVET